MENFFELATTDDEMSDEDKLKNIFNKTEGFHEGRHRTSIESYDNLLKDVSDIENANRCNNEINQNSHIFFKKLIGVVKANIFLRRGQCKMAQIKIADDKKRTDSMKEDNRLALNELNKCAELENSEHISENAEKEKIIDLLIYMELGKVYRNKGHFERKGNLDNAIDEFEKVKSRLESINGNFNREETYIWLEVQVNIGRIYKNLDELELAKYCFYEMFIGLKNRLGDKEDSFKEVILEKPEEKQTDIDLNSSIYKEKLFEDSYCYKKYMNQALIQYVILYRKERKCQEAEKICKILLDIAGGNEDAKNNLGVCYRKLDEYDKAKEIFLELKKGNNRFATINYYKCILHEITISKENKDNYKKEIEEILSWDDLKDKECQLLKGCFLLALGKTEKAYELLVELYKEVSKAENTKLEKKVYYNIAKCLIKQKKYDQAKNILESILEVHKNDVLAQIDIGWCLIKMEEYDSAKELYEKLIGIDKKKNLKDLRNKEIFSKVRKFEKMKILNNLGECYLRTGEKIADTKIIFDTASEEEPDNVETGIFLAECYMTEGNNLERVIVDGKIKYNDEQKNNIYNDAWEKYEQATKKLKKVSEKRGEDSKIISNLIIIANTAYLRMCEELKKDEEATKCREWFITYLGRFSEVSYLQRACCELAEYLLKISTVLEDNNERKGNIVKNTNKQTINKNDLKRLYAKFSDIKLWEKEEGYAVFSNLIDSYEYKHMRNKAVRGQILAYLFLVYKAVRQIKEACRYSSRGNIPVHYTNMEVLNILLAEEKMKEKQEEKPRLRLWNSVYMNDPHEGNSFFEMLQEDTGDILKKCFYYPNDTGGKIMPKNNNVYITSFSEEKDNLYMWIMYGDKAKGCNITFSDKFFDIRGKHEKIMGYNIYSDSDYSLYRVQYIDNTKEKEKRIVTKGMEKHNSEKIEGGIADIQRYIKELEAFIEEKQIEVKEVYGFLADALNEVRFLFKDKEYKNEEEMRLVKYAPKPKYEQKYPIPRLYIDVERDIQIEKITIGCRNSQDDMEKIYAWLYSTGKSSGVMSSEK